MDFPQDIWINIMSWFHSSYKKSLHYDAFINSSVYKDYREKDNPVLYYDNDIHMIDNTLYRYILNDYTFCCKEFLIDTNKWNPYMTRYSWLSIILEADERKAIKLWNHNYKYNKSIASDYNVIIKSLRIPLIDSID